MNIVVFYYLLFQIIIIFHVLFGSYFHDDEIKCYLCKQFVKALQFIADIKLKNMFHRLFKVDNKKHLQNYY
jgi:hypothetical protein